MRFLIDECLTVDLVSVAGQFAPDSPLEEDGFELVVPLSKRTAVPSSPFGFPVERLEKVRAVRPVRLRP